ncbi:MAG TPA: hypothetical protein DCZ30_02440 [Clostridiales bacterium]|nr:hypothetical protein [Clostridiales bacterium]
MENNNKQTKSNGKTALIVFLLLVTIAAVILATYAWAKYTETFDGGATAQVAKWKVTASSDELTFAKKFTHVVEPNKLAPGTNGSFTANLDVTGTEVDVKYTIKVVSIENKPQNLIIKNSAGTTLTAAGDVIKEDTIAVGDTTKTVAEEITWEWPYHTGTVNETTGIAPGDAQDTADGKAGKEMRITYEIVAAQVQPE